MALAIPYAAPAATTPIAVICKAPNSGLEVPGWDIAIDY